MSWILKFICELGESDAQPLVNCLAVMLVAFGLIAGVKVYASTLPYHYNVQCNVPSNAQSRVVLTSRVTALTTEGSAPDAKGVAAITSDKNFDSYDFTLEGSPCFHVEQR